MNVMWIKSMDHDPVSKEVYFSSGFAIETAYAVISPRMRVTWYSRESPRLDRLYSQLDRNSPNAYRNKSRFEKKFYVFFEIIN